MPDASRLLRQALDTREPASRARRLARPVTAEHDAAALTALAGELDQREGELQRQAADLRNRVGLARKLADDVTAEIDQSKRRIEAIRKTITDRDPAGS